VAAVRIDACEVDEHKRCIGHATHANPRQPRFRRRPTREHPDRARGAALVAPITGTGDDREPHRRPAARSSGRFRGPTSRRSRSRDHSDDDGLLELRSSTTSQIDSPVKLPRLVVNLSVDDTQVGEPRSGVKAATVSASAATRARPGRRAVRGGFGCHSQRGTPSPVAAPKAKVFVGRRDSRRRAPGSRNVFPLCVSGDRQHERVDRGATAQGLPSSTKTLPRECDPGPTLAVTPDQRAVVSSPSRRPARRPSAGGHDRRNRAAGKVQVTSWSEGGVSKSWSQIPGIRHLTRRQRPIRATAPRAASSARRRPRLHAAERQPGSRPMNDIAGIAALPTDSAR